ncbi:protein kinase domain-containing protein [Pseudanabaena sp. 'Roaring Creek']|uniref:protein kinase domain-containing protein n=1 Tax=Pseudanabaena sp. 'Roaring Creek' TaxID=1681830 RepID=UPI0006D7E2D8|nr:protein kinase [Pseudanabaena sp. 'Roaring Creek']
MIGQLLDGRYRIASKLGEGGFGHTYLAHDTRIPNEPFCVVKHLKPASSDREYLKVANRLFTSEAQTLAQLGNHDRIPRLLAYFDQQGEFYLVEEFVEGRSLDSELTRGYRLGEPQVIQILDDLLSILEYTHSHGVIHRDIKPDNIIRRKSDGKLVLIDFGAIKQVQNQINQEGQTIATVAIGTLGYMPSEQAQGKPRPNSDLYAIGVIGIQALTGLPPRELQEDYQTGELIWQHLVPVRSGLVDVLTKMTRYHYKDRYESASEIRKVLATLSDRSLPTQQITPSSNGIQSTIVGINSGNLAPNTSPPIPPTILPTATPPKFIQPLAAPPTVNQGNNEIASAQTVQGYVPANSNAHSSNPIGSKAHSGNKPLWIFAWAGALAGAIAFGVVIATQNHSNNLTSANKASSQQSNQTNNPTNNQTNDQTNNPINNLTNNQTPPTSQTAKPVSNSPSPSANPSAIEPSATPTTIPIGDRATPKPDLSKGKIAPLSEAEAVGLIDKLVASKNQMFAPPFDRQLLAELTTGEAYEKRKGSIDWLQSNNAFYSYGNFTVSRAGAFGIQDDQAKVTVEIYESPTLYVNGKIDRSQSKPSKGRYVCTLNFENGKWKIANLTKID